MTSRVYRPDERPDVEVRVDGEWHPGELRMRHHREDGWWANVNWRPKPGMTFVDTVREEDVRLAQVGPRR